MRVEANLSGAAAVAATGDASLVVERLTAGYGGPPAVSDVSLQVATSEFVTLLGPSGCGKTTTLRCVAGLHNADRGRIHIGGVCVAAEDVHFPVAKRDINMVFQSYAVWPHMTVFDNVAYGLRAKRMARGELRPAVGAMLDLVGLAEFADRHATELSGGQQQRVALARALATRPRLVLMDEPLSNLDARLRARMRNEIRQVQQSTGTTVLYVTHDQREALSMSDRILVMRDGMVQQDGDPWTLYNRPANHFVADFLGDANVVPGTVASVGGDSFDVDCPALEGAPRLRVALRPADGRPASGDAVTIVFRPERVTVADPEAAVAATNSFAGTVTSSEFLGSRSEHTFVSGERTLKLETAAGETREAAVGPWHLTVQPEDLSWFPGT